MTLTHSEETFRHFNSTPRWTKKRGYCHDVFRASLATSIVKQNMNLLPSTALQTDNLNKQRPVFSDQPSFDWTRVRNSAFWWFRGASATSQGFCSSHQQKGRVHKLFSKCTQSKNHSPHWILSLQGIGSKGLQKESWHAQIDSRRLSSPIIRSCAKTGVCQQISWEEPNVPANEIEYMQDQFFLFRWSVAAGGPGQSTSQDVPAMVKILYYRANCVNERAGVLFSPKVVHTKSIPTLSSKIWVHMRTMFIVRWHWLERLVTIRLSGPGTNEVEVMTWLFPNRENERHHRVQSYSRRLSAHSPKQLTRGHSVERE